MGAMRAAAALMTAWTMMGGSGGVATSAAGNGATQPSDRFAELLIVYPDSIPAERLEQFECHDTPLLARMLIDSHPRYGANIADALEAAGDRRATEALRRFISRDRLPGEPEIPYEHATRRARRALASVKGRDCDEPAAR